MLSLKAQSRQEVGRKVNKLRKADKIPAILYGRGIKSQPVSVSEKDFDKLYRQAGESSLVALEIDGKKTNVLIHDIVRDPLNERILHIDFYQVRMDEKIEAKVALVFSGESAAVKSEGGVLVKNIQEIEVKALPGNLPHHLDVDISALKTFEDHILIKNLLVPSGVEILAEPDEIVASVVPPRSEEELATLEEKIEEKIEEVKVVGEEEAAAKEAEASAEKESGEK